MFDLSIIIFHELILDYEWFKNQSCFQAFNLFTLRVPIESIVCYFHTFESYLRIKRKFTKYLKESCCLTSS